jgi:hypothetical protein
MFIINIQSYHHSEYDSWHDNGYQVGISKVFFSKSSLLDYFNNNSTSYYINPPDSFTVEKVNFNLNKEFNEFIELSLDKNKVFILYKIDPKYSKENKIDESNLPFDQDDTTFYETFDFNQKICYTSISEKNLIRIVCKHIIEGDDIYFSNSSQSEPENLLFVKSIENQYNKVLSSEDYVFRLGREHDDLFYYYDFRHSKDINLKIPIISPLNPIDKNTIEVSIIEIAFYLLKYNKDSYDSIYSLINEIFQSKEFDKQFITSNYNLRMNTLFSECNYTLKEAINECCNNKKDKLKLLKMIEK